MREKREEAGSLAALGMTNKKGKSKSKNNSNCKRKSKRGCGSARIGARL